jgi:hypothetical protein
MGDKDIQRLMDLLEGKLQQPLTESEALQSLIDAGLLDQNGNPTPPYIIPTEEQ